MNLDTAVQPGLGLPVGYRTPPSKAEIRRAAQGKSPDFSPAYPVNIPTGDARKIAFEASAVDREPKKKGGKSRRRKGGKKARKTRRRGRRMTKSRK
jgi:hypothetical protein